MIKKFNFGVLIKDVNCSIAKLSYCYAWHGNLTIWQFNNLVCMTVFSFKKFARSFSHAIRGFKCVFREQNFKVQIIFSIAVLILILLFDLRMWETVVLIMMITLVLVLEIINSIFERIMDILQPRVHPYAKTVKDMMASAVLVASLGAFLIGLLIFWPHFKSITQCF